MQRTVVAVLISLCAFVTAPHGYGRQDVRVASQSQTILNDEDQAGIIKSVLEQTIADPVIPLRISSIEFVSSENMTESMLPRISGYQFILVDPDKIEESANRSGHLRYLVFRRMRARDGKVSVGVCRVTIHTCFGWFSSTDCFSGEYHKESGSWTGELKPSLAKVIKPAPRTPRL